MIIFDHENYPQFSNFWLAVITIDGQEWKTSEHFYQANKFTDKELQKEIAEAPRPGKAKTLASKTRNQSAMREDWFEIRDSVMLKAVRAKFSQHSELRGLLLSTANEEIAEGNEHDSYWGIGAGDGKNRLGEILMLVREELRFSFDLKLSNKLDTIFLDLESTLISSATLQEPRPLLYPFLNACRAISDKVFIFTTVNMSIARAIAITLADEGSAPDWFKDVPIVDWYKKKDLSIIKNIDINKSVIIDDMPELVLDSQRDQLVQIKPFGGSYDENPNADRELLIVFEELKKRASSLC